MFNLIVKIVVGTEHRLAIFHQLLTLLAKVTSFSAERPPSMRLSTTAFDVELASWIVLLLSKIVPFGGGNVAHPHSRCSVCRMSPIMGE